MELTTWQQPSNWHESLAASKGQDRRRPSRRRLLKGKATLLDALGLTAGLVAGFVFVLKAPESDPQAASLDQDMLRSTAHALLEGPSPTEVEIGLSVAQQVSMDTLVRSEFLEFPLVIHPIENIERMGVNTGEIVRGASQLAVRVATDDLEWGVNPLHIDGTDRLGRPFDHVWPLVVGNTASEDGWVSDALAVTLSQEGFVDDDDALDDLSAIAESQVGPAFRALQPVDIEVAEARNFRYGTLDVRFRPAPGQIEGTLDIGLIHVDLDIWGIGVVSGIGINRAWLDFVLTVGVDSEGSPIVTLVSAEPHLDLVQRGDGVVNWILDHGAWFIEIIAEVLSRGPIEDAITETINNALSTWVREVTARSFPPLNDAEILAEYRFGDIEIDENGLFATLDVRVSCAGGDTHQPGLLRYPQPDYLGLANTFDPASPSVVRIELNANAANAAFHGLWQCRALDVTATFPTAEELANLVPGQVDTDFSQAPLLQNAPTGGFGIGIADLYATLHYPDAQYRVAATGVIPVELAVDEGGSVLVVGFDPSANELLFHTDCIEMNGGACRDNPLFDRLAWLALPFLPPIGAAVPLPDIRLSSESGQQLELRIDLIDWQQDTSTLVVEGGYGVSER